jgi:hypothetical protein
MAVNTAIPSKLITAAARTTLPPLGMFQKGRSRVWLGDHGWWLDVVEFQPGGWSKGSYLNVSCMWLWNIKPHISFDEEPIRVKGFEPFEDETQFEQVAKTLAVEAKQHVLQNRTAFSSIQNVSDHYVQLDQIEGWRAFNAAVAHGICGRSDAALDLLAQFSSNLDESIEWQHRANQDARSLATIIHDRDRFERVIIDRVVQTRELHKLPQVSIVFQAS